MKRFFKSYAWCLVYLAVIALLAVISQILCGHCESVLIGAILGSTIGTVCAMEDIRKEGSKNE